MNDSTVQLVRTNAPLYRDVASALEACIRKGIWKPGDQIPPESELEARFGASRGTLRAAVAELVKQGLLKPQPGKGTFVLGPLFNTMEAYFRYEGVGRDPRITPKVEVLKKALVKADEQTASTLELEPQTKVGLVRRLRFQKNEPFLVLDSYFTPSVWEKIKNADFKIHPLYDLLKDNFGVYVVSADEYLRAGLASEEISKQLNIKPGSAVIEIERVAYTFESRPIEYRRATGRADRFRYHVKLA